MTAYAWRDKPVVLGRIRTRTQYPAPPAAWRAPTGDTWPLVRVAANERTCLACGETFCGLYCERCGPKTEEDRHAWRAELPPSVPTLQYLRDGEYEEPR